MNFENNNRRKCKKIMCGDIPIGGDAPISVQSMTNTDTRDVAATLSQIKRLQAVGCDIVRLAVPDMEAADAIKAIKKNATVPLVADIHFDYRLAIAAMKNGVDKIRINPGNIGDTECIKAVVKEAKEREIPIRIGVNAGSLEKDILDKYGKVTPEGVCESALQNIEILERLDFDNIVLSIKASDVRLNLAAHKLIRDKISYPFHIGITESGTFESGKAKSAMGIGALLLEGIGDTVRVSFTGDPVREVIYAEEILRGLNLQKSGINFVSCPTCGRCRVDLEKIALPIERALKKIEPERIRCGKPSITVAVMGCEVNGPGEAKNADIGVACGKGKGAIFQKGKVIKTVNEDKIVEELLKIISL